MFAGVPTELLDEARASSLSVKVSSMRLGNCFGVNKSYLEGKKETWKRVGGIVSKGVEQLKSHKIAWIVKNKNYFWSTNNYSTMYMIPLIQGLRKTIKTVYDINFQLINGVGDNGGIAEIDGVRGYASYR